MLAENLRAVRQQKGLTLEQIAERVNVTRQTMCKYEQGIIVPNAIVLVDIAEKLGVTCEELVRGKPTAN